MPNPNRALLTALAVLLIASCRQAAVQPQKTDWKRYRKAYDFLQHRQNDSAFYEFNEVAATSRDRLQVAMAYNNMAVIQSDAGDHYGAQESLSASLKMLDEEDPADYQMLARDYNELGNASGDLRDHDAAIGFYDQALRFTSDTAFRLVILNNKAYAYQQKKAYVQALRLYEQLLRTTRGSGPDYARLLNNLATTRWLLRPAYRPVPDLLRALAIRRSANDRWGENSSYAHLADYYLRSRPDSAYAYARAMYRVARQLGSPADELQALDKLIRTGPPATQGPDFERYRELDDSLQTARGAAKNQFALIRYQVQKGKADNLRLQKDNAVKRLQIIKQQVLILTIAALAAVVLTWIILWARRRKKRMEAQAQQQVREGQLRTSKKVHDVVANGLYRLIAEIESDGISDPEELLDRLDQLYDRSRNISYEPPVQQAHYAERIARLLTAFGKKEHRIAIVGNAEPLWEGISPRVFNELENVLQELMVNMHKHSRADLVSVRLERSANKVIISYQDNGTGFPQGHQPKNGLTNTGNRMLSIGGSVTFDTGSEKGLQIRLEFPVQ